MGRAPALRRLLRIPLPALLPLLLLASACVGPHGGRYGGRHCHRASSGNGVLAVLELIAVTADLVATTAELAEAASPPSPSPPPPVRVVRRAPPPPSPLSGWVVWSAPAEGGVGGADLVFRSDRGHSARVRTDGEGRFQVGPLPPGRYDVWIEDDFLAGETEVWIADGLTTPLVIEARARE